MKFVAPAFIFFLLLAGMAQPSLAPNATQSSTTSGSSFTWETRGPFNSLDPNYEVSAVVGSDNAVLENVYETLVWYNGTSATNLVPWLASSYTISPGGTAIKFTLRDGITFADGNPLNSTAVYFSFNRWVLQEPHDNPLCCDFPQNYTASWVRQLLAQDLVTATGTLSFQLKVLHPDAGLLYRLALPNAGIMDPAFVMSQDMSLWTGPKSTVLLPYPLLIGSEKQRIGEYLTDEAAVCSRADTTYGCNSTYLYNSANGSSAGTGPYTIRSSSLSPFSSQFSSFITKTGGHGLDITLSARHDYWGGPQRLSGQKGIAPTFDTVYVITIPLDSDRLLHLENAARKGIAISVDVNNEQLYNLANTTVWLEEGKLSSIIQNVTLYGPLESAGYAADAIPFMSNVSDPSTGRFYPFQPFADIRMRLAFADSVDIGAINRNYNDNLGQVASNLVPPFTAPPGAYNSSDLPRYSFNPTEVKTLLVDAMEHPLTNFRFFNGTAAPEGLFNNTFGCRALNAQQQCGSPVPRTITLAYRVNDSFYGRPTIDGQVVRAMALEINSISDTYHMGLHVAVEALPVDVLFPQAYAGNLYLWAFHNYDLTPWIGEAMTFFSPTQGYCDVATPECVNPSVDGVNSTQRNTLYYEFTAASSQNNLTGVVTLANRLLELANGDVNYIWVIYPYGLAAVTSNVRGVTFNPSTFGMYFASLAPAVPSSGQGSHGGLPFGNTLLAAVVIAGVAVASVGIFVMRRRSGTRALQVGRRLAAIMFTDIAGYTALTQKNERLAMDLLAEHNRILRTIFPKFAGREVKTIGDSFLVEFSSALEAVQCAVAIQEALHSRNLKVQPEKTLRLRIGIHVGDVINEGGDILGDAVNISSRIEPLAEPGGLCISEQVYDQVRNKTELHLVKLDNVPLKNVSVSVDVYRVVMPWEQGGS